jgi:hypothetical protein
MELAGAHTGQSTADAPSPDHVAPLSRSRVPTVSNSHQVAPVPDGNVNQAGIDPVDHELAAAGETLMAIDNVQ